MSGHTPGPWFVYRGGSRGLPHIRNVDGLYVMDAPPRNGKLHASVRQDADARLIAAAPELLTSLQALVALHDEFAPGLELNIARRVIAKATGGEA